MADLGPPIVPDPADHADNALDVLGQPLMDSIVALTRTQHELKIVDHNRKMEVENTFPTADSSAGQPEEAFPTVDEEARVQANIAAALQKLGDKVEEGRADFIAEFGIEPDETAYKQIRLFERDSVRRDYDNERLDCERRMRAMECLLDCVQACRDAEIEFPWPLEYTFPPEFLWEAARREFKRWNDHGRRYVTYDRRYPFFQPKETQNHHLLQPTVAALCASWVPPVPPNVWV